MAWHSSTNQSPATYTLGFYQLITVLLAAGWTKIKDSDGTTYSSSGTQVTGGGTGANGLNNVKAWVNMKAPGSGNQQFVFQRGTAGDASWRITYSPAVGFTSGSPSATQVPSATDSQTCLGSGSDGTPGFSPWFTGTEGSTRYNARANDAAPYAFWCQGWPIGGGTSIGGMFYDGVVNGAASESSDNDQHVICVDNGSGFVSAIVSGASHCFGNQPSLNTMSGMTGVPFAFTAPQSGLGTDPTNGRDMLRPLEYYVTSGGYYKGQTQNILWEMTGTGGSPRGLGYTLTLVTTADYIVNGTCALPWDGSSPLI